METDHEFTDTNVCASSRAFLCARVARVYMCERASFPYWAMILPTVGVNGTRNA